MSSGEANIRRDLAAGSSQQPSRSVTAAVNNGMLVSELVTEVARNEGFVA
jgi:hypothetical protein